MKWSFAITGCRAADNSGNSAGKVEKVWTGVLNGSVAAELKQRTSAANLLRKILIIIRVLRPEEL